MQRRMVFSFLILILILPAVACYAPAAIPLTGNGTPTPADPSPTATATPNGQPCKNKVTFVDDVTVPDNTQVAAGQPFTKTWRVRNEGTCPWGPNGALNALVFTGGYQMGAQQQIPLGNMVEPGQLLDISVQFTAPVDAGTYASQWMFRVNDGGNNTKLGVGADGKGALYVQVVVK